MENQTVAYIVHVKKRNSYSLFMANVIEMEGEDDSVLQVTMNGPKLKNLEDAQEMLKTDHDAMIEKGITPFYNPINSSDTGFSWLSELKEANPEVELVTC